jgi:hypothetical protein
MGIPIIHIITIMGITLMATFRSIMMEMMKIIEITMATLIMTLEAVTLVVILMGVTAVVVTTGGGALDRQTKAGAFRPRFFRGNWKNVLSADQR